MTIMILGVGDAGTHVLNVIARENLDGLRLIAVNTQPTIPSPSYETLLIGENSMGSGGNPDMGKRAAEHSEDAIRELIEPASRLLIVCGLGGGTGTGGAPVIARYANEMLIHTVAAASLPFNLEGSQRTLLAKQNTPFLRQYPDETVIVDSNEVWERLTHSTMPSLREAFGLLNRIMAWNTLARVV